MSISRHADCFIVINGPEDGTEFPVTQARLDVGSDPACAVHLSLDRAVRTRHAQLTAASNGYRIRSTNNAPLYVDNQRVGSIRSAVIHEGGIVRVGNTLLCLECAPEGIARRSQGIVSESDGAWAIRQGFAATAGVLASAWGIARRMLYRFIKSKLAICLVLVVLFLFWPQFRHVVIRLIHSLTSSVRDAIASF